MVYGCGSTSGVRLNLYSDNGTTPINYYDLPSYYGYTYGSWSFTNWMGSHTYKLEASGGNGHANFSSSNPCVPNWQCELPLNGQEADGCGNTRLNPICDAPTCIQSTCAFSVV